MKNMKKNEGFTLIEILVVIGIIAVLATIVLIAINPARQFAQARDSQRVSNLNSILNSVGQRIADGQGDFTKSFVIGPDTITCPDLPGPGVADALEVTVGSSAVGEIDLECLVPTYIPDMPFDPRDGTKDTTKTLTAYKIYQDGVGRVHVIAEATEDAITRTDPIETVR